MRGHQSWIIFILSIILIFPFSVQPSLALIDVEHNSMYDANSESEYPGEEVDVTITIDPGDYAVSDMQIEVSGAKGALIDYGKDSFEATILPAGEVVLKKTDISTTRMYECERLKPGEMVELRFRAYPKTIRDGEIDAANVEITYTQLGERLSKSLRVKTDLGDSSWFELKSVESDVKNSQTVMYAGIIAGVIGILLSVLWLKSKGDQSARIGRELDDFVGCLKDLQYSVNDDAKRVIEDRVSALELRPEYVKYKGKRSD
jgi:hypothetical protein